MSNLIGDGEVAEALCGVWGSGGGWRGAGDELRGPLGHSHATAANARDTRRAPQCGTARLMGQQPEDLISAHLKLMILFIFVLLLIQYCLLFLPSMQI